MPASEPAGGIIPRLPYDTQGDDMPLTPPADCADMATLRAQIDAIDTQLIDLLALRARYIDRAIPLKLAAGLPANTTDRVAQIIAAVREQATTHGLDPDLAETLWRAIIDWGIAHEAPHLPN